MIRYNIDHEYYYKSNNYDLTSSAWVESLSKETQNLILDFTIMWNMLEHMVFNDMFNKDECDVCCNNVIQKQENVEQINKVYEMFCKYNRKYLNLKEQYDGYHFRNNDLSFETFKEYVNSENVYDRFMILILSCYRIRCNLFHGIKNVTELDNQKLLFFSINEFMAIIARRYGY